MARGDEQSFGKIILVGTFSGACSCFLLQPLDLVKTRLQYQSNAHNSKKILLRHVVPQIVKSEGYLALWKGLGPSLLRMVPGVSLYFLSLDWLQSNVIRRSPTHRENLFLGACSRVFAGVILLPATVLKTRFESSVYQYSGIRSAFKDILVKDGWRSLYSGLVPTVLRDAPFSGLYLMFYRGQKGLLLISPSKASLMETFLRFGCGVNAGVFACLATHPFDVMKTRMQLFPKECPSSFQAARVIYNEGGFKGFLRGIVPRALRRTLMVALSWTVFEEV